MGYMQDLQPMAQADRLEESLVSKEQAITYNVCSGGYWPQLRARHVEADEQDELV